MSLGIVDVDHVMIRVFDLEAAAMSYRRLGFTVTPVREKIPLAELTTPSHTGGAGRAAAPPQKATINNRHVIFQPFPGRDDVANFLEFMCIEDQLNTPPQAMQMLSFLLDTEGPKAVVGYTEDVDRSRESMRAAGIETYPPIRFETGWRDEERDLFVPIVARPAPPVFGQFPFQVGPYETPTLEGYRYQPWTVHPNGALYLTGISGITDDVRRDAQVMAEKAFGVQVEYLGEDIAMLCVRDMCLRIMSPRGFASLYPGLDFSVERSLPHLFGVTIVVRALDEATAILDANDVAYAKTPGGVCVPRHAAHNTLVEFVEATSGGDRA
jgi:hypothetical protein